MYLLTTKPKQNQELAVAIGIQSKFHEFKDISDLIDFIFNNAPFIESYKIYITEEMKKDPNSGESTINFETQNGFMRLG